MSFYFPEVSDEADDRPSFSALPPHLDLEGVKAAIDNLEPIMSFDDGSFWFEMRTDQEAWLATHLTQTAIFHFYKSEFDAEGGHPRRWFTLVEPTAGNNYIGPVCLCVTPEGARITKRYVDDCHTTGLMNRNPYPDYAEKIEALSEVILIPLPENHMGRPISAYDASEPARP